MHLEHRHIQKLRRLIHNRIIEALEFSEVPFVATNNEVHEFIDAELTELEQLNQSKIDQVTRARLKREIIEELTGFGPIAQLMLDASINDILINAADDVWVDRNGQLERSDVVFDNDAHLRRILDRLVAIQGKHLDASSPMVDLRLKDGSRLHAVVPPLCKSAAIVSIRKFRLKPFTEQELLDSNFLDQPTLDLIQAKVRARANIVVAGGASVGKTTFLNFISRFIPATERIVTIEDTSELSLDHPHVIGLESRTANTEGSGKIELTALVRTALRMRADRIIIGEVRGHEVLDMLQAMNIGHSGSMTTVHANSAEDAIRRLQTLCLMGGDSIPADVVMDMIGSTVELIIQLKRDANGRRKVVSINELTYANGQIHLHNVIDRPQ